MRISKSFIICLLFTIACDPGRTLILRNSNHEKLLRYENFYVNMFMDSMNNLSLGLNIKINTKVNMTYYVDLLRTYLNNKEIKYNQLYFNGKRINQMTVNLEKDENFLSYGFLVKHKSGDDILVFGEKILRHNNSYFNIDTTIFSVPQ